jgi:hypothetical protein
MAPITPEQARAYLERWRLVRQTEVDQLRSASMETKLQQLSILMASRGLFSKDPERGRQADELSARWARIRKALSD